MKGVQHVNNQTWGFESKNQCCCEHHLELDPSQAKREPETRHSTKKSNPTEPPYHNPTSTSGRPVSMPFEASFIQIPSSTYGDQSRRDYFPNGFRQGQQQATGTIGGTEKERYTCTMVNCGVPEYLQSLSYLQKAALSSDDPPPLCMPCLKIVFDALENDSDRLQMECLRYHEVTQETESRIRLWKQAMSRTAMVSSSLAHDGEEVLAGTVTMHNVSHLDMTYATEEAFRNEILLLESACQQYDDELKSLRALEKEHALSNLDLDNFQEALAEEQITLELEARAFNNDQEQLTRELGRVQNEIERLYSSEIRLPAALVHLQVDVERGLRYPLINDLRLAFRPKGDIEWKEIQAAWALAAELLLVVATLFEFQSQHWTIVPLSHCAKLIYRIPGARSVATNEAGAGSTTEERKPRTVVFNLGHPKTSGCKALLTWNALMHQVVQHVKLKLTEAFESAILDKDAIPPLPFALSSTSIGGISLPTLDENDDAGWSRITHYMASVLLWMSECASTLILCQVLLVTPFADEENSEREL